MEPAFWDSSALVPLCVQQQATPIAESMSKKYGMVVWWAAPVEVRSAFARLLRMGQLASSGNVQAQVVLARLRSKWSEISPDPSLRGQAEDLLDRFTLKAADALQLAAGLSWTSGRPRNRAFVSGDAQLLDAARQLGFQALGV
jgi:predicted nucleic acid-binding protein